MMTENYAQDYIDDLYEEGEFDITSLSFLFGAVNFGGTEDEDCLNKTDVQCLQDAFILINYLISSGDFEIGKFTPPQDEEKEGPPSRDDYIFKPYENIELLKKVVISLYEKEGFNAEPFHSEIWLKKKSLGKKSPMIPDEIKKLFRPA
ncbi:hypothetical protein [Methylobacillus sp. Pita1]|uniref:hypothetical protein n=1 Tax=Methylobacillus sp. Pita1 TaxID=3382642 RepID=UPI0038B5C1E5